MRGCTTFHFASPTTGCVESPSATCASRQLLERTMTLLNRHDLDIDDKRQFRMHLIQHAEGATGHPSGFTPTSLRYPIRTRP